MWYRADVARLLQVLGALVVSLGACSMGCFTDPVNDRPTVSIVVLDNPIVRGAPMHFSADAHDDQSEPLTFAWGTVATQTRCASTDPLPGAPTSTGTDNTYQNTFNDIGWYCVFVTATDKFGATGYALTAVQIVNQPPVAVIRQVAAGSGALTAPATNVALYSSLRFTASQSSDPDSQGALTFVWTLTQPDGSTATPMPCAGSTTDVCIPATTPGAYVLQLQVTDSDGAPNTAMAAFTVATDQPPCIVATDPPFAVQLVGDPDADVTFAVTGVADDGDPWPAPDGQTSSASFVWSWRTGTTGPFSRRVSYSMPSFTIPGGTFQLGDTLQVRVEADDRVDRTAELAQCRAADPPVCELPAKCDRWVTWSVELIR
jgi:hypothetical protein